MIDRLGPPSPAPEEVAAWMDRYRAGISEEDAADVTSVAALSALRDALRHSGRDREGAFALLAADGLLTEATRDLLGEEDPERAFEVLIRAVAGLLGGGPEGAPE